MAGSQEVSGTGEGQTQSDTGGSSGEKQKVGLEVHITIDSEGKPKITFMNVAPIKK